MESNKLTETIPRTRPVLGFVDVFFNFGKEELIRRVHILNIILKGMLILAICAQIVWLSSYFFYNRHQNDISVLNALTPGLFILLVLSLIKLSRSGYARMATVILISLLLLIMWQTSIKWGVNVPMSVGVYSLIILLGAVLIGPEHAVILMLLITASLLIIFYLQNLGYLSINEGWKELPSNITDVVILNFTYFVISLVSWLTGKEISRSIKMAKESEQKALELAYQLRKQNKNLEAEVEKRIGEIKDYQLQRVMDVNNLAEFGKISAALLHDIKNPLTVISLNLDSLKNESAILCDKDCDCIKLINQSMAASATVESIIKSTSEQLADTEKECEFDVGEEINKVINILDHKAIRSKVRLQLQSKGGYKMTGYPVKLSRVVSNLIMNSIDSFTGLNRLGKSVKVVLRRRDGQLRIIVTDNGCGIRKEDQKRIFQPFFSNKNSHERTGIGLYISQKIIKDYFGGQIIFKSVYGRGSQFVIKLPEKSAGNSNS